MEQDKIYLFTAKRHSKYLECFFLYIQLKNMIKKFFEFNNKIEHDIDSIVSSYLEAVIFTEYDNGETITEEDPEYDEDGDNIIYPFNDKNEDDFSDEAKKQAYGEIAWFIDSAGSAIDDIADESIGHDIWLTRNGHGAGFWDRGYDSDIEEVLEQLSKELGSTDAYVGDDGKIYFSGGNEKYKNFNIEDWKKYHKIKKDGEEYNL